MTRIEEIRKRLEDRRKGADEFDRWTSEAALDIAFLLEEVKRRDEWIKRHEAWKEEEYNRFLEWRGIVKEDGDTPCKRCGGSGRAIYGSTATWLGGIGGQAMTSDVCDKCWGSGNDDKPWMDLRKNRDVKATTARRCAEIANSVQAPKSIGRDKGRHHEAGAQHAAAAIRKEFNL